MIEEYFVEIAGAAALLVEALVVFAVAWGSVEALVGALRLVGEDHTARLTDARRAVWFRFATWIVLALEFALGTDIIRSAIAPTWQSIGELGAIAAIRTLLNFFLMRDIQEFNDRAERRDHAAAAGD